MKKVLLLMLMMIGLACCSRMNNYTYTTRSINRLGDEDTKIEVFKALSDSLAFIEAYERHFISEKTFYDVQALLKDTASYRDLGFSLTDDKGRDILSIPFHDRDSIIKSLYYDIVTPYKVKYDSMLADMAKDRIKVDELKPFFNFDVDEFEKCTWVKPKDSPKSITENGIYCYFSLVNGKACNLRFKIQYRADDWLFIRSYKILIDGDSYDYNPNKIERDHCDFIWEWSDAQVTPYSEMLLNSLKHSKAAKIRFVGRQYNQDRNITPKQLVSIKRTMDLFYSLGGKIE